MHIYCYFLVQIYCSHSNCSLYKEEIQIFYLNDEERSKWEEDDAEENTDSDENSTTKSYVLFWNN